MKRILMILVLSIIIVDVNSKIWINKGATWHYEYSAMGSTGFYKVSYEKDTLIENIKCEKLVTSKYVFGVNPQYELVLENVDRLEDNYTYSNGDTIFYLVKNKFKVLYNFASHPGDTWNLGIDTNKFKCSKSIVMVDSVGTMNINENQYRWISISPQANSSVTLHGKIVEHFGAMNSYLFPLEWHCDSSLDWGEDIKFSCFQDDSFNLYNATNKECEYMLSVNSQKLNTNNIIYPTITSGIINILQDDYISLKIFSIEGKELYMTGQIVKQIDLNAFNAGIYLIVLEDKNNKFRIEKLIKK